MTAVHIIPLPRQQVHCSFHGHDRWPALSWPAHRSLPPSRRDRCHPRHAAAIAPRKPQSGGHWRCSAAASAAAASSPIADWLFVAGTLYTLPFFLLMILAPDWHGTQGLVRPDGIFVPLALAYGVLLARSWSPDTLSLMMPGSFRQGFAGGKLAPQFFPSLEGIVQLFSRPATAASLWIHLLCINLFAARWAYQDGRRQRLPTRLSVLFAAAFGPLGMLCHFITQAVVALWRGGFNRAQEPIVDR